MLSCEGCGACCEEQGLPPTYTNVELLTFLPKELRDEIAEYLDEERRVGITRNQRGLPCIWHAAETGKCIHYDLRPKICCELEIGGCSCRFWLERRPPKRKPQRTAEATASPD
jgi:Fe-S-cluster containining protein